MWRKSVSSVFLSLFFTICSSSAIKAAITRAEIKRRTETRSSATYLINSVMTRNIQSLHQTLHFQTHTI